MNQQRGHPGFGVGGQAFLDESARPDSDTLRTSSSGTASMASVLLAGEVEVLDAVGHLTEAVAGRQVVVEVAAARAHAADVQRQLGFGPRQPVVDVVADRQARADHDVERTQRGSRLAKPARSDSPHTTSAFSG